MDSLHTKITLCAPLILRWRANNFKTNSGKTAKEGEGHFFIQHIRNCHNFSLQWTNILHILSFLLCKNIKITLWYSTKLRVSYNEIKRCLKTSVIHILETRKFSSVFLIQKDRVLTNNENNDALFIRILLYFK